ncbi:MAG: transcription termination factor NusA [Bacilli bacterium]
MDAGAFIKAVDNIAKEKDIDKQSIFEAIKLGLISGYKKNFNSKNNVEVELDTETGEIKVFSVLYVVDSIDEEDEEKDKKILLEEAKKIDSKYKIGDVIKEEVTPKDFGRVATGTVKQVVMQKVREAERDSIINEFQDKEGELVSGVVFREDAKNYYIELSRSQGILPKSEIIPGENIVMASNIKVYITKIEKNTKGPLILLSRKHHGFLKRLLELEIPELQEGSVLLHRVAREPGFRSKIAVYSENSKIDPIGACIGEKGSRINRISNELNGEKIDVIKYEKDPEKFIQNALNPAKNARILITDLKSQEAMAILDNENLSLAIGKQGQNVRLAARLTHFKIDVKSEKEAAEQGIVLKQEEE